MFGGLCNVKETFVKEDVIEWNTNYWSPLNSDGHDRIERRRRMASKFYDCRKR
jgi:hypothetical protein